MTNKQYFAYMASAGSGKTYALALRYIALLFMGQNPSEILAATFTKKAANEMKQRVLKLLNNLDKEVIFLNSLISEYGFSKEEILAKKQEVLNRFLKSQNYIVTLDSFFNYILRSGALQIDLEPDFKIKTSNIDELQELFFSNLERNGEINSLVKLSYNLQKRHIGDILKLLFDLFDIDALMPKKTYKAHNLDAIKSQINSVREALLKEVTESGASITAIKNFEPTEFKSFILKSVFNKKSLSEHRNYKKYVAKNPKIDELYLKLKSLIATYHKELEETILSYLFSVYERFLDSKIELIRAKNELSFSDILYFTHRLLYHSINKDFLYFKLDTKFKHILLDEFQDTSALQFLILKPLIDEIFSGSGQSDFRTFFYVGDVKQSLYRFRGGVEELFFYVAKKYDIKLSSLDTNYRSAKLIVDYTNRWFKDILPNFTPQKANSSIDGYVEVTQSDELALRVKEKIEFLLNKGVDINDIALLTFTNKDGVSLQEYLKEFEIDSILKTSSSLKHNQKIAALVGVLEFLITGEKIYIAPFKQKIGVEEIDLEWFKAHMSPYEVLKRLVEEYNYFDDDLNILKLLDFAKDFITIEEFLQEFKDSNIELAQEYKSGVKILTIHGSKGLEFKYVIVVDRLGGVPPNRDLLLFENKNPLEIKKIYYKHRAKENFLTEYANALEKEKNLSIKDKLNLLYVALTRAELGLIVVKKSQKSEFDKLNLEELKDGKIELVPKQEQKALEKLSSDVSYYGKQKVEELDEDSKDLINLESAYFGEAMHFMLENLDFKSLNLEIAFNAMLNRYGAILNKEQINSIKKRVKNLIINREFLNLINGKKLYKEQPISFKGKLYQIDLLAKSEYKNIIFDYKSSKNFYNEHIKQVKNYINALKTIDNKETKGYLLYMLEDMVEVVEV